METPIGKRARLDKIPPNLQDRFLDSNLREGTYFTILAITEDTLVRIGYGGFSCYVPPAFLTLED